MKHCTILFSLLFILTGILAAQVPQSMQYQAVIRDGNGNPLLSTPVQFRFSVESNGGGQLFYQETQSTVTNALGGINLVIGTGNATTGNFQSIDWKTGAIQVRVEMDPTGGTNFSPFGTNSMQSVPYALYALKASSLDDDAVIDPASIGSGGADVGQVLIWDGDEWGPGDDTDEQTLTVNGNQLSISNGNAVTLPTGSGGGDDWGDQTVETNATLAGDGTLAIPLKLAQQGAVNGDVLKWNGSSWAPEDDNGANYTAGNGININNNVITNTGDGDANATNEIQTLSINGNTLSLTNGGSVNLPAGNYTQGTGINIAANVISANNTQPLWNANKLQGRDVESQAPTNGQVLKWDSDDSAWGPAPAYSTQWSSSGSNIYYNAGNVGFGVSAPLERIHVFNEDKIRMDDQTFGKFGSISMEFTSNIIPEADDTRDLGLQTRRWDDVYASSGIVNTSDRREKENIHSINYGLDDLLKLNPVSFTWKNKPEKGTKLGLIAQELEMVIPEVVSNPNRTPSANSEPEASGEIRLGVYYSDLIPVLIKAIQEQQVMITELQAEVAALKVSKQ